MSRALPGLGLCLMITALAYAIAAIPSIQQLHLSPLVLAIILGIAWGNLQGSTNKLASVTAEGLNTALRPILRGGIILLGFRLSFAEVHDLGATGLLAIVLLVSSSFTLAYGLGRIFKLSPKLSLLIAAGHSICGASAVLATDSVVNSEERDTAVAVGLVTLLGTAVMFAAPVIGRSLELDAETYGFWVGASIHEVAQVVGAGFAFEPGAGEHASLVKLTRVACLVPVTLGMLVVAWRSKQAKGHTRRATTPWFVLGFVICVALNSASVIPPTTTAQLTTLGSLLLAIAMAALGLRTDLGDFRAVGPRPFAVGIIVTAFLSVTSLFVATLLH